MAEIDYEAAARRHAQFLEGIREDIRQKLLHYRKGIAEDPFESMDRNTRGYHKAQSDLEAHDRIADKFYEFFPQVKPERIIREHDRSQRQG